MKKVSIFFIVSIFLLTQVFVLNACAAPIKYGVFIGLEPSKISKLIGYNEVVIDASYYTKENISYLHKNGVKVYSYLNVGSIENFRSYYNDFVGLSLGDYENWDEEKWMDVSNEKWKAYIINVLAKELKDKGIDGFFLDNFDVYGQYKTEANYNGLIEILNGLNSIYNSPIIVNGGYEFFTEAMNRKVDVSKMVYGVNTESVYTTINFDTNTFLTASVTDRGYAIEYLNILKSKGLKIYIIEYTKNTSLKKTINTFYNKLGFNVYISSSLTLN